MFGLLDDLKALIPSEILGDFVVTVDHMPDTPIKCITLIRNTTANSFRFFGHTEDISDLTVTMNIRSEDYDSGLAVGKNLRELFNKLQEADFLAIHSLGNILPLGKDENNNRRFMLSFRILLKE